MTLPAELDGARVIGYTSNNKSNNFGFIRYEEEDGTSNDVIITGMAIAMYDRDKGYYLFSCDIEWNVIGDTFHNSLNEAIECAKVSDGIAESDWICPLSENQ
ncbi:hypothetical protein [Paenibacillus puerhi]|uniref:hypothetical protein n=1 Tax=Paenibacillus puerhi TaxID=2692622 RepID=UPI0013585D31|nr:hypothetical protein [Paenibacillus puerhi]